MTASKRGAVSVQDTVGGIRAVTGEFLEQHNLRTFEDIARLEPSLQFAKAAVGDLQPIIRGIQSPGVGTVGVYFDETVITGANFSDGGGRTPDIGAYDIERVEILKGPQGTLFGASSMSGTIRFIPNKPDAGGFDARLRIGGDAIEDGDPGFGADGMVNIPIVKDVFALRGVIWHESRGGFIDEFVGLNAVNEQWFLTFGLTWLDAALTEDQVLDNPASFVGRALPPLGLDGDNIPKAPEWAFSGSVEYAVPFPLMKNVDMALRANFSYTDESNRFFNNSFDNNAARG